MELLIAILLILASLLIGYLLGSIPFGIIVGKLTKHVDIRTEGSKSSGGTNAGRVLGKKYGFLVIVLDALKCLCAVWLIFFSLKYFIKSNYLLMDPTYYSYIAGLGACLGHTFPIFASFKGGKAVACYTGLIISLNWGLAIIGFISYFIVLKITKYVSLTSIIITLSVAILGFIPIFKYTMDFSLKYDFYMGLYLVALSLFILIRHKDNIIRLKNHEEKKITWMH